jgi:hypothetical protein
VNQILARLMSYDVSEQFLHLLVGLPFIFNNIVSIKLSPLCDVMSGKF